MKNAQRKQPFRIGIIGGMGPMAGVLLQRLIIEATPAEKDQDHLQVVCFTNPQVPDRTRSLKLDGGDSYVAALKDSIRLIVKTGVDCVVIPCNTAHARLNELQEECPVPIVNMVEHAFEALNGYVETGSGIGLLATDGTVESGFYQKFQSNAFRWVLPAPTDQRTVMDIIYRIKAGRSEGAVEQLAGIIARLQKAGAATAVLGCTELSQCFEGLARKRLDIIDPLRSTAAALVELALMSDRRSSQKVTDRT